MGHRQEVLRGASQLSVPGPVPELGRADGVPGVGRGGLGVKPGQAASVNSAGAPAGHATPQDHQIMPEKPEQSKKKFHMLNRCSMSDLVADGGHVPVILGSDGYNHSRAL